MVLAIAALAAVGQQDVVVVDRRRSVGGIHQCREGGGGSGRDHESCLGQQPFAPLVIVGLLSCHLIAWMVVLFFVSSDLSPLGRTM